MSTGKRVYDKLERPAGAISNHEQRKRPRLSDLSELPNDDHRDSAAASPASEEDGDEDDEYQPQATQALRDKYELLGENRPVENGIIERVDCFNFMCHEHLSMELGPLINFIVGKNGSGKSAVLTALTLCLGGRAAATNRGQSLKNFIKEGKEAATIIVRIKNQGGTAYAAAEYGRSIIVERHFSRNGTSGFRIKNASGRVVSTKRTDLDSITDYFALQIDNPMNVLSQDMARQFLSTSSPAEKYKFFLKGVQLEQLDQDYSLIEESITQLNSKLKVHSDELKILEAKRDKARGRLAVSDRHEGIRARLRNLRAQMAWAQVEEQERIRDCFDEELRNASRKAAALEAEVEDFDKLFQDANANHETAAQLLQEAKSALELVTDSKKEIQARFDSGMKERHEVQATRRSVRDHINATRTRIDEFRKRIQEEIQRLEDINGGSSTRKVLELEAKQAAAEKARSQYMEHKNSGLRLKDDLNREEIRVSEAVKPLRRQRQEVVEAENYLQTLMRNRNRQQQENGFPHNIERLTRAVAEENSFARKPIGPLGSHITLTKPLWSSILEKSLGATLNGFVVTSKRDSDILTALMQRVDCVCPIFIGNENGQLDTNAHEPERRLETALRVLQIDHDIVRRQLVINHGIEQMLLVETLEEGTDLMFSAQVPKNVKRCFCIDAKDRRRGIHLGFTRSGDPSQAPLNAYTGRPRMRTDVEIQITMQQEALDSLKESLIELENKHRNAQGNLEKCKQALVRHERRERELQIEVQKADDLVEQLKEAIDRDNVEDGRLEGLRTGLAEAEEEMRVAEASYEDGINAYDALVEKLKEIKRELAAKDVEITSAEEKVSGLELEVNKTSGARRKALSEKNAAIARVADVQRDRNETEQKREQAAARVLDFNEKASMVASRVPIDPTETASSLDRKLAKLTHDLKQYDKEMGASREEIAAACANAESLYDRTYQRIIGFQQLSQMLGDTLNNRRTRWQQFRGHISARAKMQFTYLLSERSFRGKLLTNHERKLLDLQVEPDTTKKSAGRGAKTLSGGEKSFSQICLLLSLWEAMGSPIRCLDEFDVYMDSVNRKITIEMLMGAARRSVGRQFIFITPGSRAEIRVAMDVRVIELAEPERGQSTISFRQ